MVSLTKNLTWNHIFFIIILIVVIIFIWNYIENNWPAIIISSIIGFAPVIYDFKNSSNAEKERISQSKNELLDILENFIINNREINFDVIKHLKNSVTRKYSIDNKDLNSALFIVEDLNLRFEKSNHLAAEQKEEYSKKINKVFDEIDNMEKETPIIDPNMVSIYQIKEKLESDDVDEALNLINNSIILEKRPNKNKSKIRLLMIYMLSITLLMTFYLFFIQDFPYYYHTNSNEMLYLIILMFVVLMMALYVFLFILRRDKIK